mmetsp:Transcript_12591/g.22433  ORF Transcript_12591/g.22433 Transcript_12591/m.22433 type:complete len:141 (-) Transcript_12591:857-1279(-)
MADESEQVDQVASPPEEPRVDRRLSARSGDVIAKLRQFDDILTNYEKRFGEIVLFITKNPPREEVLKAKDELAIMVGEVDKLQMNGLDSVVVVELTSGREEARNHRKKMNQRAESLSGKIKALHQKIQEAVHTPPTDQKL